MAVISFMKDPAQEQFTTGFPNINSFRADLHFEKDDITVLRELGKKVAEIAARDDNAVKAKMWTDHNDLKSDYPLVFIDPENGWNEVIPPSALQCKNTLARVWEMLLRKRIHQADVFKDDRVIDDWFDIPYAWDDTGWGVTISGDRSSDIGSYLVKPAIEDYERDFPKLHFPKIIIDWDRSDQMMNLAADVFHGILRVRRKEVWWWGFGLASEYIMIRGFENFLCDLRDEPEWVRRMLQFLQDGYMERLDFLESNHLLSPNNDNTYIGSGGLGYTTQLPPVDADGHVRLKNMWGMVDGQETIGIDPDMFAEFFMPHLKQSMERFGMCQYGCCEPFDPRWKYIKQLPRLRRVSVSAWAKWELVPELLGKNYVASVKPSPAPLAASVMDESAVRNDARRAVELTKGGVCEFLMKDNHTFGQSPQNGARWVEIMREEIRRVYG